MIECPGPGYSTDQADATLYCDNGRGPALPEPEDDSDPCLACEDDRERAGELRGDADRDES